MDNLKFLVIPFPSVQKHHHLHILFISLLMLVLAGCSSSENEQEKSAVNINLTNKNIVSFSQRISDDYFTNINALFQAYQKAALSDKPHEFIISSPIKPLFEEFENLIYIGLDLKNGLLNADQARISNAYSETKQAKLKINSIRQQLGLPPLK
jgi:hypothetical protein